MLKCRRARLRKRSSGIAISILILAYQAAVEKFERLSQKVVHALASDELPSGELLASEEDAREAVLAARSLLLAEMEVRDAALRSSWPLNKVWASVADSSRTTPTAPAQRSPNLKTAIRLRH